ncbi:hypothetical protein PS9374_04636 [Planomonospora sphaerica]|uniref:Uncharacterized protein n=1 Tax=Planomonospora sphaerica TaxID=161355 RepID=A0A171DJF9_9ACTN|nr:hypothetical protein [Planomonospora sphaerica]GAT68971.1 hypothetical protein PS9374_04636 [Planomonospora sphaerica]
MSQPASAFVPTPPAHRLPAASPDLADQPGGIPEPAVPVAPRWMWEAMEPDQRRAHMTQMAAWVDWLRERHSEPPLDLKDKIPACWYLHPGPLDILTTLYAEWIRTHAPASDLPLISFYDALARHAPALGYPGKCLRGSHDDQRGTLPGMDFATWILTSAWATAPALPITFLIEPETSMPTPTASAEPQPDILPTADITALVEAGHAERLGRTPAVRIDGTWWLGDESAGIYVRVPDPQLTADLDRRLAKYTTAQAAVARQQAGTPLASVPVDGEAAR